MKIGRYELKRYEDEEKESIQPEEVKVDKPYKLVTRIDSPLYEGYNFGKYNPNLLFRKKGSYTLFDEMRQDDQINAVLNLIKYIILGSAWDIECKDNEEVPEFIKKNLNEQLDEIFIKKLYNILTAFEYGFSLTEKVFTERDGKIILGSLKTRPPHGFDFQQDEYGKIIDIIQTVTDGEIHLNPSKFIHYAYQEEFDNPYGKSALNTGVYRAWWSKNAIIKFYNIYLERHGMPFGVATYPKGTPQPQIEDLKKIGKNIQAKTFMVAPEGVVIDFKEASQGTDIFERAINQHNTSIARNLLLPDLLGLSGGETGGGSYALGDKQFEIFYQTIDFERRKLERLITDEIIRPLVQWNFGTDIEAKFSFTPVDKTEKRELLKIWLDGVKSGKIPMGKEHVNWFLQNVEAPEISEEELAEIEVKKEEEAAMIQGGDPNAIQTEDKKENKKLDKQAQEKDVKDTKPGTKEFSDNRRTLNKYEKNAKQEEDKRANENPNGQTQKEFSDIKLYYNENHDKSGRFASGEGGKNNIEGNDKESYVNLQNKNIEHWTSSGSSNKSKYDGLNDTQKETVKAFESFNDNRTINDISKDMNSGVSIKDIKTNYGEESYNQYLHVKNYMDNQKPYNGEITRLMRDDHDIYGKYNTGDTLEFNRITSFGERGNNFKIRGGDLTLHIEKNTRGKSIKNLMQDKSEKEVLINAGKYKVISKSPGHIYLEEI